jgi:hypothetical protein
MMTVAFVILFRLSNLFHGQVGQSINDTLSIARTVGNILEKDLKIISFLFSQTIRKLKILSQIILQVLI